MREIPCLIRHITTTGRKANVVFDSNPVTQEPFAFFPLSTLTNKRRDRQCKFCNTVFKACEAQAASRHILQHRRKQPDNVAIEIAQATLDEYENKTERKHELPPLPAGRKRGKSQSTLAGWGAEPVTAEVKKRFDCALFIFVVMAGLSFAAVDSPWFLAFTEQVRPVY